MKKYEVWYDEIIKLALTKDHEKLQIILMKIADLKQEVAVAMEELFPPEVKQNQDKSANIASNFIAEVAVYEKNLSSSTLNKNLGSGTSLL